MLVGNEVVPEFTAKTLPPGSAPSDKTFKPNSANIIPPASEVDDIKDPDATTSAVSPVPHGDSHHVRVASAHLETTELLTYSCNGARKTFSGCTRTQLRTLLQCKSVQAARME